MRRGLLREHRDFRRLWVGDSISQLGTQVSMLAIPLTAVSTLHAGAFQVGLLTAAQNAAFLLIGLPVGAWVDRTRRRPVLVAGDVARAVLLTSVPVAAALGVLRLGQLYLVVFATGAATVFFDVAYQSYLPSLVDRADLMEGNGRLEASRSTAYLVGPGLAGYLVQALTPPLAVLADAASFVWSAAWITAIRGREPIGSHACGRRSLRREIAEGLHLVRRHPVLRALTCYNATAVLFLSMEHAIDVIFLVRTVGLSAAGIGLLYGLSSIGAVTGAFAAPPLARRLGQPRTILLAAVVATTALLLVPLTGRGARLACYVAGGGASTAGIVVFNITALAFRQTLCPGRLLARVNATMRFLSWGTIPVGSLLGGTLATAVGNRPTLWISATGCVTALPWLLACPTLRSGGGAPVSRGSRAPGDTDRALRRARRNPSTPAGGDGSVAGVSNASANPRSDPAIPLRDRLRAALPDAMKARDRAAVAALRSVLAAIENAEAVEPEVATGGAAIEQSPAGVGVADAPRRALTDAQAADLLRAAVVEWETAAQGYDRAGRPDRAQRLRDEARALSAFLPGRADPGEAGTAG